MAVETISDDVKYFILTRFIEDNQSLVNSLIHVKNRWTFFSKFIRLRPHLDEKEVNDLATLAAYLHLELHIKKSVITMQFIKLTLIDYAFDQLKQIGALDHMLNTEIQQTL